MIFRKAPATPKGFAKRKGIVAAEKRIADLIAQNQAPASADFTATWGEHKQAFCDAQQQKCAFCETRFAGGYVGDIEHYRPKAEVKNLVGAAGRGNRNDTSGDARSQTFHPPLRPGYWWLAYRWENWTFSCSRCNGWKLNQFPLLGGAAAPTQGCEKSEQPGLLNPFVTDPEGHFAWSEDGTVAATTPQGQHTIDVVAIDRASLVFERKRVAKKLRRFFDDWLAAQQPHDAKAEKTALRELFYACCPDEEYAAMARQLVQKWTKLSWSDLKKLHPAVKVDG